MADYADFGGLFRDIENAKGKAGSTPDVFEKTLFQNLPDFLTYQVPNSFVIRYRAELKHHSLGQSASALILYVLSQRENDVVIIDQPEDDLDNQTIYDDVIKLVRQMKFPPLSLSSPRTTPLSVLGDAEQVHACRYQDDEIRVQTGSIDAKAIQTEIINIMEGGEEAFNKRKEVYSQWKPQELIEIIARGEDSSHQFKADVNNADSLAAEIVAFSNSGGGRMFIGVSDNNKVVGLSAEAVARINQLISNSSSQNVRPAVNPLTENVAHPDGLVMVVRVADG